MCRGDLPMTRQQQKERRKELQNRRKVINQIIKAAIEECPEGENVVEHAQRIGKERYGDLATFALIMKLVIELLIALYGHDEDNLVTDI